jgi:hypothetical protein
MKEGWSVEGYRVEDDFFYELTGILESKNDALKKAAEWYKTFDWHPNIEDGIIPNCSNINDVGRIPDRVYIKYPDGTKRRFVPDR